MFINLTNQLNGTKLTSLWRLGARNSCKEIKEYTIAKVILDVVYLKAVDRAIYTLIFPLIPRNLVALQRLQLSENFQSILDKFKIDTADDVTPFIGLT